MTFLRGPVILILPSFPISLFETFNAFGDDFAISDEVALAIDHVRNRHYLVDGLVGELERYFGGFDVKRHYDWIGTFYMGKCLKAGCEEVGKEFEYYSPTRMSLSQHKGNKGRRIRECQ